MFFRSVVERRISRAIGNHRAMPVRCHDVHVGCPCFDFEFWIATVLPNRMQESLYQRVGLSVAYRQLTAGKRQLGTICLLQKECLELVKRESNWEAKTQLEAGCLLDPIVL